MRRPVDPAWLPRISVESPARFGRRLPRVDINTTKTVMPVQGGHNCGQGRSPPGTAHRPGRPRLRGRMNPSRDWDIQSKRTVMPRAGERLGGTRTAPACDARCSAEIPRLNAGISPQGAAPLPHDRDHVNSAPWAIPVGQRLVTGLLAWWEEAHAPPCRRCRWSPNALRFHAAEAVEGHRHRGSAR